MERSGILVVGSAILSLLAASPVSARDRRDAYDPYGTNDSVGRNAVPAIAGGLGGMADNWLDTMGNAYAQTFGPNRADDAVDSQPSGRYRRHHR